MQFDRALGARVALFGETHPRRVVRQTLSRGEDKEGSTLFLATGNDPPPSMKTCRNLSRGDGAAGRSSTSHGQRHPPPEQTLAGVNSVARNAAGTDIRL